MTNIDDMPIKAIAPWFGGKRTLAPTIIAELGEHRAYWEPFCGSMAVLLAKPPASMETVNDLHGDLINVARTIRHPIAGAMFYRRLRRVLMSQQLHHEIADELRAKPIHHVVSLNTIQIGHCDVDRAVNWFAAMWIGRNGVAGTKGYNFGYSVRYTKNGGHSAKRFDSAVASIPAWRRRMRNANILSTDGLSLCGLIEDSTGVVIYADPPYLVKGAKYLHDFDWLAHRRLAETLNRFQKTRVVVSYYAHPDLAAMYPGWTVVDCTMTKSLVSQNKRDANNNTVAPEVLLINGPSYTGGGK